MSLNSSLSAGSRLTSASVIGRIEDALEGMADALANARELKLSFSSRRRRFRPGSSEERFVRFPGSSAVEARKFARVLLIIQLAHQAMTTGTILTKRHIYYQHQELFETQRIVDELVDDLAYTLGVDRDNLNITASSKGSISGCMNIYLHSGEVVDASQTELGVTVPLTRSVSRIEARHARWLLVVEKDAVFRSLVAVRFWETSLAGRGVLVTAKGYPDLMTRSFLAQVQVDCPHLSMLVLSDFDPDGLNIFSCYRYGTTNFSHESSNLKVNFGWLGIQSGHLGSRRSGSRAVGFAKTQTQMLSDNCLVNLTSRDRVCATRMLGKSCQGDQADYEHMLLRRELQIMLMLGTKAEIQSLDDSGDITSWLDIALQKNISLALAPDRDFLVLVAIPCTAEKAQCEDCGVPAIRTVPSLAKIFVSTAHFTLVDEHTSIRYPEKMAPQLTEDEIDDLVYFARTGEDLDLMESVTALAEREKVAPAVILMATKDEGKSTVLHMATGNGHLETVRKVIQCFEGRSKEEKQAFLDEPNEHGNTGMHWAALGGHLDTVKLLMEHGASPALANERDYVPLDLANQNEKTEVSKYFLSFLNKLESENTDEGLNNAAASIEVEETAEDGNPESSS